MMPCNFVHMYQGFGRTVSTGTQ